MTATQDDTIADLQRTIAELRRERDVGLAREATLAEELAARDAALAQRDSEFGERIEQQSATVDVLKAMSASPDDPQPVFDLIVERARDLCDAHSAGLYGFDGTLVQLRAATGVENDPERRKAFTALYPRPATRDFHPGRAILDRQIVRIHDVETEPGLSPLYPRFTPRSGVAVPLLRDGVAIGALGLGRRERGGFSDSQIELLKTFAEQAVIAITSAETYRALQTRTSDLQESLEYQTATSDVLKVISRSTFDLQPVLDTVVEAATRLCDADQAMIWRREGDLVRLVANYGFPPEYEAVARELGAMPLDSFPRNVGPRAIREGRVVHVHDVAAEPGYAEVAIRLGRQRTSLGVPLLREGETVGSIVLARQRVEPFTDRQMELVSTFADQAVIAIENTRLITEQREALEQQTATAEVLQVINASPGDLTPVFDTILDKAMRLCEAAFGGLFTYDGERFHTVAALGTPAALTEFRTRNPPAPLPGSTSARLLETRRTHHILDRAQEPDYLAGEPGARAMVELGGARSMLNVPLIKDDNLLGYISIYRQEVRPFSDKQIALLESFAAQAVIAMENARLLQELRQRTGDLEESLEYQTATSEVLNVISRSTFDLGPVFQTVAATAVRLCNADQAGVYLHQNGEYRWAGGYSQLPEYERIEREVRIRPGTGTLVGRVALEGRTVQILDAWTDTLYEAKEDARVGAIHTLLGVPLLRDGSPIGVIGLGRQKIELFTERQIELVSTFAAQAVIAMENARLITEQREALEQQTATAEVLQVINASPGNLAPVFDAVLEKAVRLCQSSFGILGTYDGECIHNVATRSAPPALADFLREPIRPTPGTSLYRIVHGEDVVHIPDIVDDEAYRLGIPSRRALTDLGGARTLLLVALRKDETLLGLINVYRQEVRPFTDKQIALLQNFAAQAVIAMENARLINEQREALEQQTATAEVLQVINTSPGNLAPVFEAILEKAHRLCGARVGALGTFDGTNFRALATHGYPEQAEAVIRQPYPREPHHEPLFRGEHLHVRNVRTHPWTPELQSMRIYLEQAGLNTMLSVPLRKDGVLLGFISAASYEVRPFSEKEIALLENFAAQAVIAMDNARLINEQREALEQQTATAEVLQVINVSPGNLRPVFEAMLERAMRLCEAAFGELDTFDGERFKPAALLGIPAAYLRSRTSTPRTGMPGTIDSRFREGANVLHITDLMAEDIYRSGNIDRRSLVDLGGARTALAVALRKDDVLLGNIMIYRQEVRPFSDRQVALLQNFAAQAVVAMENARLITEQHEALEQQTATAEVLQVINASPGNLAPVFDAILEKAHSLCDIALGSLELYDGERFRAVAVRGSSDAFADMLRLGYPASDNPATRPLIEGSRFSHIRDLAETDYSITQSAVELNAARTLLCVPLRRDETLLGMIASARGEVRPFSEKEIALLENFAAQAVIAIENARLLNEQREALEQQTATAEVLQIINESPGNLTPVFDTVLEKAIRLCDSAFGMLATYDGHIMHYVAMRGLTPEQEALLADRPLAAGQPTGRIGAGENVVHLLDARDQDGYRAGFSPTRNFVDQVGARTAMWVALRKDKELLGILTIFRREVRAFTDKEVALIQNFAAQAVIAMENARLLDEIRQRQEELRITFENMGDGVAMFDETQHLIAWNRKFQEIFDVPDPLLAEQRTYADYIRYLAERGDYGSGTDVEEHVRGLIEQAAQSRTYERTRPDGRVIEIRHNPVPGGGFVLIYADITERKRNEAEIRAARDAAEEASRTIEAAYRDLKAAQANLIQAEKMASLGQLTAGIAHEIKNPLNFVNNFSALSTELIDELRDVLAPEPLGETARTEVDDLTALLKGNLEKVVQHGQRADGIVRSMLDHSRGSSGERRMVDLNALIDEALNLAYHGARAQDQAFNITLERDFGEGIAPIEVNPQDITRVFLNLFANGFYAVTRRARDGGDAGFVPTLKVTTSDAGDALEIRVRDNGTGIPADIRDKLFQPFFTTKPTGEGTGLGLSITYDIVTQQHGGSIAVDSKVGEYSEFTIRLPRNP